MAKAKALIWLTLGIVTLSIVLVVLINRKTQSEPAVAIPSYEYRGICSKMICTNIQTLMKLRNCTIVLGYLQIAVMERTTIKDLANISFPELREVTGYMIMYRVFGLQSIGKLFPNLARIRGSDLLHNYALIIYDLPHLLNVGLYSLLKVDRGGVIVGGGPLTCYMDTINWETITNGRHVVFPSELKSYCSVFSGCSCSLDPNANYCWSNIKCQRFLEGPEAEKCDSQCFGCRKSNPSHCTLCRHYTFRGQCLSERPKGTIVYEVNKYCIPKEECIQLGGWSWNNTCVFECPKGYVLRKTNGRKICERCDTCEQTCDDIVIQWQADLQAVEKCVYINGSLTIHIRAVIPEVLQEMRETFRIIQEVSDYILIYGSLSITSLDFLSSLQRIGGRKLFDGKYSLVVRGMHNLQSLFTPNVTNNLIVDNGKMRFYDNPMLCMSHINELKKKFPNVNSELDIPLGMNGYSGACDEVALRLKVEQATETSAEIVFNRMPDENIHYFILYVRTPQGTQANFVPETCSDSEWNAISVPSTKLNNNTVRYEIQSLHPASSYAVCIETYNPDENHLARSSVCNFNTDVGKPEPPFIIELVASSPQSVVIRWVDHKDYKNHVEYYELDVSIVEIYTENIASSNHCVLAEDSQELDYSSHAVVKRPPRNYEKGCESMCGVLSTVTEGAMTDEYFDVCSLLSGCNDGDHPVRPTNTTFGKYVKTLALNISSPINDYQIGNLAPFRNYRFELRACTKHACSRTMSNVVKTLRLKTADVPIIELVTARELGSIEVRWRAPKTTNGPVLAYNIEILPILPNMEKIMPRVYCVPGNITSLTVTFDVAEKYIVRICSTTLGSNYVCSNGQKVAVTNENGSKWWQLGFLVAIIIYIGSLIIGWLLKPKERRSDEISLVDMTSTDENESVPPSQMLDFEELCDVSLQETCF